jgi:hypothetical protein
MARQKGRAGPKPMPCQNLIREMAEQRPAIWARRWVDLHGQADGTTG